MPFSFIPYLELTPERCADVADTGEAAIAILREWHLTVVPTSELAAAVAHLRLVASRGSFGQTPQALLATAQAMEIAIDWFAIGNCLTEQPVALIAEEINESIKVGANARKGADIRTQFWFGAILARAGLRPGVPDTRGRRPDFVVMMDDMPLAVEVKRPESLHSTMRAAKDAVSQIRDYGRPGFLVLDLGPALRVDWFSSQLVHAPVDPAEEFRSHFRRESQAISGRIRGHRSEGKWSRLAGLFAFAKLHAWQGPEVSGPFMKVFMEALIFEGACSGLIDGTSRRVKRAILSAFQEFSFDGRVEPL